MKKTDWYTADVDPVRPGLYEVKRYGVHPKASQIMLRWDGADWSYEYPVGHSYAGDFALMLGSSGDKWRGLTAPSK
jgi:hypothetical protein